MLFAILAVLGVGMAEALCGGAQKPYDWNEWDAYEQAAWEEAAIRDTWQREEEEIQRRREETEAYFWQLGDEELYYATRDEGWW